MDREGQWRERRQNENFPAEIGAVRWDVLKIATTQRISIDLMGVPLGPSHAVVLTVHVGHGSVSCGDLSGRGLALWLSEDAPHLQVDVVAPEGLLTVEHAWKEPPKGGNPEMIWKDKPFSAMLVEDFDNRHVYHCNTGHRDEAFDRLIFSLELQDSD